MDDSGLTGVRRSGILSSTTWDNYGIPSIRISQCFRPRYLRRMTAPASFPGGVSMNRAFWIRTDVKGTLYRGAAPPFTSGLRQDSVSLSAGGGEEYFMDEV